MRHVFMFMFFFSGSACLLPAGGPSLPAAGWTRVRIQKARDGIVPFGHVDLDVAELSRSGGKLAAGYTVKVFPFFFFNEHGSFELDVPDSVIESLAAGNTVEITGGALNHRGKRRALKVRAEPSAADPRTGRVEVRLRASGQSLCFRSTYRFVD